MASAAYLAIGATGREQLVVIARPAPAQPRDDGDLLGRLRLRGGRGRLADGVTDAAALAEAVDEDTAAVFIQQPNFLGAVEDLEALARAAKEKGAL